MAHKLYLGDGVYGDLDERGLVLTTENGIEVTNTIVLEPDVWSRLEGYVKRKRLAPDAIDEVMR